MDEGLQKQQVTGVAVSTDGPGCHPFGAQPATPSSCQHGIPNAALPIDEAPHDEPVLVWWPIHALDENDLPEGPITGGQWLITERNGDYWLEPDVLNCLNSAAFDDDEEYAYKPACWLPVDRGGLLALVIRLHNEGILSEGQVAQASRLDRPQIRLLAQRAASGIAARSDATPESGSAEGKSPAPEGDAQPQSPEPRRTRRIQ